MCTCNHKMVLCSTATTIPRRTAGFVALSFRATRVLCPPGRHFVMYALHSGRKAATIRLGRRTRRREEVWKVLGREREGEVKGEKVKWGEKGKDWFISSTYKEVDWRSENMPGFLKRERFSVRQCLFFTPRRATGGEVGRGGSCCLEIVLLTFGKTERCCSSCKDVTFYKIFTWITAWNFPF